MGADAVAHGAVNEAELAALGITTAALLDFSSNLNPFGPPAPVRAALAALDPAPYPDRSCHRLRLVLAARHGCDPAQLLATNGANEAIHLLARALLQAGDSALVIGPTFGEYAHASRLAGAHVVEWRAEASGGFAVDVAAVCSTIARLRPRLTWLCAPNNPTGVDLPAVALATIASACAEAGGWLALDRAYAGLRRGTNPLIDEPATPSPRLAVIHSLTKSYGLAGLRLGYLLAEESLIAHVAPFQPAWSVNSAAQAAGLAALADGAFLPATLPQLWAASDGLHAGVAALGLPVWRGALPFLLVETGAGAATRAALLARGCLLRDCASFGLPTWVRVAPRRPEENARLLAAWREVLR
ncbi:MAG: histidinol-phosphate aminotransferase family protein [Chloroflexaceae bacterium]|jgi:threonine-phosphate decarboxylase|nr:histidinol-phosphate aminotransferase family protein [Chloroflexaceae bacterium]